MAHLTVKANDTIAINKHFQRCKAEQIPYVLCKVRRTKADVEFDFISFDTMHDALFKDAEREILAEVREIFNRHKSRGSSYMLSSHVMTFQNLDVSGAEKVAMELYAFIAKMVRGRDVS